MDAKAKAGPVLVESQELGAGDKGSGPFSAACPAWKQGVELKLEESGLLPELIWDAGATGRGLE